jgi:hypothetical protein
MYILGEAHTRAPEPGVDMTRLVIRRAKRMAVRSRSPSASQATALCPPFCLDRALLCITPDRERALRILSIREDCRSRRARSTPGNSEMLLAYPRR